MSPFELRGVVRGLLRTPSFSLPTVLILALGIGATATIFAVVKGVLLSPLPWPDDGELLVFCEHSASFQDYCVGSVPTVQDLHREAGSLEAAGTYRTWSWSLTEDGESVGVAGGIASPAVFGLMGARPALGRFFTEEEIGPERDDVAVLGHAFWTQRYGGDPSILGRTVDLDGDAVTIVGVLPSGFELPEAGWVELWRPLHVDPTDEEARAWRGFVAVGRLADGARLDRARSELGTWYRALAGTTEAVTDDWSLTVRTLRDHVVGDVRRPLLAFLLAAGLLLAVACANVANLLFGRGLRRERELAVRAALGAPRGRLVRGVLLESLVLTGLAGILGLLLALGGAGIFTALAPPELPRLDQVGIDLTVVGFTVAVTLAVVLAAALLPALRIRGLDPAPGLRTPRDGAGGRKGVRTRRLLVVGELALSLTLLFGTALLVRTFSSFTGWDPGFDREGLVATAVYASSGVYRTREEVSALWARMEDEVESIPAVAAVGTASSVPLLGGRETSKYRAEGMEAVPGEELPAARWYDVGPGYFEALGVPLVAGRGLRESDGSGSPAVVLVNETFARRTWPGESPLGKRVSVEMSETLEEPLEVVGVVADVPPLTPGAAPEPELYWSNRQFGRWGTLVLVRVRPGTGEIASRIQERIEGAGSQLSVGTFRDMESLVAARLVRPRFNLWLMGSFGAVTALLALVGLYGVLAYEVARGARSIGVRLAVGSSPSRVVRDVLGEAGLLAVLGVGLGTLVALAVSGLVSSLVHGVSATDPTTLVASGAVLILLALLASAGPALRASRMDPARLLRET